MSGEERRLHKRFPLMKDIAKPVELYFDPPANGAQTVPAVLIDLSAGGMGLLSFVPVDLGTRIMAQINIPGLNMKIVEGKVMWTLSKGDSHKLGISFTKIDKNDLDHLNKMANDYTDCEKLISSGEKVDCSNKCHYFILCDKPQKNRDSRSIKS